jgi:hypothetical protein
MKFAFFKKKIAIFNSAAILQFLALREQYIKEGLHLIQALNTKKS